jgi:decaprenylphospho-beta-D-ribofuranose 2-oxidase
MLRSRRAQIAGWGQWPVQECRLLRPEKYRHLSPRCAGQGQLIARGLGRSYGDAALNENGQVLLTQRVNRFLEFDRGQGIIRAESGVSLADMIELALPAGWFPAVVPGTRQVSLGGCVAADVHGKNHHRDGSFGGHLLGLELFTATDRVTCSSAAEPDLFRATIGGMGLTGVIGEVTMRLRPVRSAYIIARHQVAEDLESLIGYLTEPSYDDHYTVAWLDCFARGPELGRGIVISGHHAEPEELSTGLRVRPFVQPPLRELSLPVNLPGWLLSPLTGRVFNEFYFRGQAGRRGSFVIDCGRFFFPLDGLDHWYRLYGRRGFLQYQCVLGGTQAAAGVRRLLERLQRAGCYSLLAVLKRLGPGNDCPLSFPREGYTLALDIPRRALPDFSLLADMDRITLEHGGRVYLAKDARLDARTFRMMYPDYPRWLEVKRAADPDNVFSSSLARRLDIGGAG